MSIFRLTPKKVIPAAHEAPAPLVPVASTGLTVDWSEGWLIKATSFGQDMDKWLDNWTPPKPTWDPTALAYRVPGKIAATRTLQEWSHISGAAWTTAATDAARENAAALERLHGMSKAIVPEGHKLPLAVAEMLKRKSDLELRPYQVAGLEFVLGVLDAYPGRGVLVADEPGVGKTPVAIATLEALGAYPALIVTTASSADAWRQEILGEPRWGKKGWLPWRTVRVIEGSRGKPSAMADITITSYDSLWRNEWLMSYPWQMLIGDESSSIKNVGTRRFKGMFRSAKLTRYKLLMNGTPVMNHHGDLVTQLDILGWLEPEFNGRRAFESRYMGVESIKWSREAGRLIEHKGSTNGKELHERLSKTMMLRRSTEAAMPWMPQKTRDVIPLELPSSSPYWLAEEELGSWISKSAAIEHPDPDKRRGAILAKLVKLRGVVGESKVPMISQWAKDFLDANPEEKAIIFSHHGAVVEALEKELAAYGPTVLVGNTTTPQRREAVADLQHNNDCRVLLGGTRSAGMAITLTRAATVLFGELDWTAAMHDQAERRAWRSGQMKPVQVKFFVGKNTVDERVWDRVLKKALISGKVHDGEEDSFIQAPTEGAVSEDVAKWLSEKWGGTRKVA